MPCPRCERFPSPTVNFVEVGISLQRHGTLYKCRMCGTYFEIIAEERGYRMLSFDEVRKYYSSVLG